MLSIRELVKEALQTGILTLEAEKELRQLLSTKYDLQDLHALMTLQHGAISGRVRQQSRQQLTYSQT
ncbi:hypothetical protein NG798_09920 [Ancylothrix sp. C2]|uniref:hypothetical protein n=1 Tax=Ancylothrix sp. D3o TaxID=2953691 RepID=UPI0021BBAF8A|nr:hypothetical protein [Ancylothrix sp. D3o]MCT7950102.1 hypothetical protein [Ancylothrix sp. D3o]